MRRGQLAENSRPFRQFKEELHDSKTETRGRKPKEDQQPCENKTRRVHWMNPLLFQQIDFMARKVGYPWSPTEIVRRLRAYNSEVFDRLDPRRISEWRNSDISDRLVWKDWVQANQKRKHRAGGISTRTGILVSMHTYQYSETSILT